ncbi:NTP transferase domain-containing protein [Candidatus Saccharibacteria bacterium]|nr:MAG: NTP transferase domain-containing protein [Candidatus Saccharibacteria bacterium]
MNITKAIIPVAGWGTRMLPITKSIEKCMLPIGNRPVIDFVVQDVIKAGIKDIYFVVGEQSAQLQSYYRSNIPLNDYLRRAGKADMLDLVRPLQGVNIHFITQPGTGGYGTSVPIGMCSEFIDDNESALVMSGDQFFYRHDDGSNAADFIEFVSSRGLNVWTVWRPSADRQYRFCIIEIDADGNYVRIVEKPKPGEAPTDLQNASFYVFPKEIFELARALPANPKRGEFEVTDAINAYVASGQKIAVGTVTGDYMECGSVAGWLRANQIVCADLLQ